MPVVTPPENATNRDPDGKYIENTVFNFVVSNDDGQIDAPPVRFGAGSEQVYYNGRNPKVQRYTLSQLFEAFIDFLESNHYLYAGEEEPVNPQTKIWIDTTETNESTWQ